ncbi:MAG: DMT family transporter [Solirubrobacterales bacterium]
MSYVFLAAAVISEVVATLSLRASEGLSKAGFVVIVAVGYIVAFALLSAALSRGIPVSIAYALWAAAGVSLVSLLSVPVFGESLGMVQIGGLLLIVGGVVLVEMGGSR